MISRFVPLMSVILLLGLADKKQKQAKASKVNKGVITGSKERGYVITNCNLVIYDEQKAFDYAFNKTAEEAKTSDVENFMKVVKFNLFGDCLSSEEKGKRLINSKEKALFVFDLYKFLDSGISSNDQSFDQNALTQLDQLKQNIAKITGFDTSDFKVELVKKL